MSIPVRLNSKGQDLVHSRSDGRKSTALTRQQIERRRKLLGDVKLKKQSVPSMDAFKEGFQGYAAAAKIDEGLRLLEGVSQTLEEYFKTEDAQHTANGPAIPGFMDMTDGLE